MQTPDAHQGERDLLSRRSGAAAQEAPGPAGVVAPGARLLAILALSAVVCGRALSAALPGSTAGIGRVLRIFELASATITQLLVLVGLSLMVTFLVDTLWHRRLNYAYRLAVLPAGASVVLLVALSTRHRLSPVELAIMGGAAVALGVTGSISAMASARTRGPGLALGAASLSALASLAARVLLFVELPVSANFVGSLARGFATLGFCLDLACLGLVMAWVSARRTRWMLLCFGLAAATATAVTLGALVGSADGAALWEVLSSRAMSELTRDPAPWIATSSRYFVESFALALAAGLAVVRWRTAFLELALVLILLVRQSVDVPVPALLLGLAALVPRLEEEDGAFGVWTSWARKSPQ